jgi:mono/diheme cytochrome c family protein
MRENLFGSVGIWSASLTLALMPLGAHSATTSYAQIERGRYLVTLGDCAACHTTPNGKPFAGGLPIQTPFGVIYTPNITPDRQTGIGAWSDEQFYKAMHEGVSADGRRLYPAFPYPYYTRVNRDDVQAIRDYLNTLQPISNTPPANKLPFPLNERIVMKPWDWLFFDDGTFKADPKKSTQWNRGAYLVEGLGHCGACHTPKNVAGADEDKKHLEGSNLQNWAAPDLTNDKAAGLNSWSEDDIVAYLKTGRNAHSSATGPMSDVIVDSTSKMKVDDLFAMATYLKDLPDSNDNRTNPQPQRLDANVAKSGEAIYLDQCAACHRSTGEGVPGYFPPLKGSANAQQHDPTTVLRLILEGARSVPTDLRPTPLSMPAFDWKLSDEQIAAVASYVRNSWGNSAPVVNSSQVKDLRGKLPLSAAR